MNTQYCWLLAGLAALLLAAGCSEGYPRKSAAPAYSSETLFGYLERVVHGARSDVHGMDLLDPCTMEIEWSDGAVRSYDMLDLRTAAPRQDDPLHEAEDGRYAMLLHHGRHGDGRLLVQTPRWGPYMLAVSSIAHLRRLCALSKEGPSSDAEQNNASAA